MCVTDRHDLTIAIKVALNLDLTNQPTIPFSSLTMRDFVVIFESIPLPSN